MAARSILSLQMSLSITPLSASRPCYGLTSFTTSKHRSNISTMHPKVSEGQDESKVSAEAKSLHESGWEFDDEKMGLMKTYNFKTYTKALVGCSSRLSVAPTNNFKDFLYTVGVRSKSKNHHSKMVIVSLTLLQQNFEPCLRLPPANRLRGYTLDNTPSPWTL